MFTARYELNICILFRPIFVLNGLKLRYYYIDLKYAFFRSRKHASSVSISVLPPARNLLHRQSKINIKHYTSQVAEYRGQVGITSGSGFKSLPKDRLLNLDTFAYYGLDSREIPIPWPTGTDDFYPQSVQTGSGAQAASCSMGNTGTYSEVKTAGAWCWQPSSI